MRSDKCRVRNIDILLNVFKIIYLHHFSNNKQNTKLKYGKNPYAIKRKRFKSNLCI